MLAIDIEHAFSHFAGTLRGEAPKIDHLRDYASNLEKSKAVQFCFMKEDRKQEDDKFFDNFISKLEIIAIF